MNKLKGFSALFLTALLFSYNDVCIRIVGSYLSGLQQVTLRSLIGVVIILIIILFQKKKINVHKSQYKFLFIYATLFPFVFIFFNLAIILTKIVDAVFAFSIGSLAFSLFIEQFFWKEKITFIKITATLLTIIGTFFFSYPLNHINLGFLFGIISGLAYTLINALIRHVHEKTDIVFLVGAELIGGIIIAGIATIFAGQSIVPSMPVKDFLILLTTGTTIVAVNYLTLVGFKNFDLNLGTIVVSAELIFAPILAVIFFREYLTSFEIIGAMCIAVAIILPHITIKKLFSHP